MPLPKNITAKHVRKALLDLDAGVKHPFGKPTKFVLVVGGKHYPPKAVIGLSAKHATGKAIGPEGFSGGEASGQANDYLRRLGFHVEELSRNPKWVRDELILALDLYFQHRPDGISKNHPGVVALSELLNRLPIHSLRPDELRFRNPNGVYMKLCNFLRFDPAYGGKGLERGGHDEELIWNEFADDRKRLHALAEAIRAQDTGAGWELRDPEEEDLEEAPEGRVLLRLHKTRERNQGLVKSKKEKVLREQGCLKCEVCGFDFRNVYGELGDGFIECHHGVPLSQLRPNQTTKLQDLHLVCANCHRMLHRGGDFVTIDELRRRIKEVGR